MIAADVPSPRPTYVRTVDQEFAIDALLEYGTEAADANLMVPIPVRKDVQREVTPVGRRAMPGDWVEIARAPE